LARPVANRYTAAMPIHTLHLLPYQLPFRETWRSAAGNLTVREGWLLRLEDRDGGVGYGDCAPLPGIGCESPLESILALQGWREELPDQDVEDALAALNTPQAFDTPAARAAVECALLDLLARRNGRSLSASLRGCDCRSSVRVNSSLGALGPQTTASLDIALGAGFDTHKLKIGLAPATQEIPQIKVLCRHLPPGHTLRLDANRAWDQVTARTWIDALAGLPIDSLEEPLAQPDAIAWAALQQRAGFPLALDESLADLPQAALLDGTVRRLVLKLPRLGGIIPAITLAQRFAATGGDCVVTSCLESACGLLAAAHLAAALGGNLAHGLATAEWLAEDLGASPTISAGRLELPTAPGLGFTPITNEALAP